MSSIYPTKKVTQTNSNIKYIKTRRIDSTAPRQHGRRSLPNRLNRRPSHSKLLHVEDTAPFVHCVNIQDKQEVS